MRPAIAYVPLGLWAGAVLVLGTLDLGSTTLPYGSDKAAHFVLYGIGGALTALAAHWGRAPAWPGLGLVAAVAAIDELRQARLPYRDGDPVDFIADLAGGIVAFGVVRWWLNRGGG